MNSNSLTTVRQSKEFYSAVIRFVLGLFIALYVWIGMSSGEFSLTQTQYNRFAIFFFVTTLIFWADIFRNPDSQIRRYFTLIFDFSCTTYTITLTGVSNSEFILIYIWLYIAYGTRYGSSYLLAAVMLVMVEYNAILLLNNVWSSNPLGPSAQLFVLIAMPLYLHSMLKQLREAKLAAEQATRAKSNFLATMSHEIRTPMSGIIGTAHLLQTTQQDKTQKEYTQALLDASKSLHALIDDILDFSKIEANKLHLQHVSFDLQHTINEVVAVLSPNAEHHSLELIVFIDPQLPRYVIGDSQRIRQILFNLLGNAIKFTEQGEIKLRVSANKREQLSAQKTVHLRFDIIDSGIGISKTQQQLIFNSFTQADSLQNHKFSGTGLGTTIAKQLVEVMGGHIDLSSELGKGSHFWFNLELPIDTHKTDTNSFKNILISKRIALLVANDSLYEVLENYCQYLGTTIERFYSEGELLNGLQQSIKHQQTFDLLILSTPRDKSIPIALAEKIKALDCASSLPPKKIYLNYLDKQVNSLKLGGQLFDSYLSKPVNFTHLAETLINLTQSKSIKTSPGARPAEKFMSLNILIAEDEDINAMVLSSFLQDAGHRTKRVLNGAQAVDELSQNHYDIAFMDMRMPQMDGIEAALKWRSRESEESHIPIIALTANATKDDRQACLQAGMDDFITKPVTPEQLAAAIARHYSIEKM